MRGGACQIIGAPGGLCPLEPGVPDNGVVGPRPLAALEPGISLVKPPATRRQVGPGKPDPVIFGSQPPGSVKRQGHAFQGIGIVIETPQRAQSLGRIDLTVGHPVQEAPVLVISARHPAHPSQQPTGFVADFTSRLFDSVKYRLSHTITAGLKSNPAARQCHTRGFGRIVGHALPGSHGGVGMALRHLADTEPELDLALPGPALRQMGQPRLGVADPPRGEITRGQTQLESKAPGCDRLQREPGRRDDREPECRIRRRRCIVFRSPSINRKTRRTRVICRVLPLSSATIGQSELLPGAAPAWAGERLVLHKLVHPNFVAPLSPPCEGQSRTSQWWLRDTGDFLSHGVPTGISLRADSGQGVTNLLSVGKILFHGRIIILPGFYN